MLRKNGRKTKEEHVKNAISTRHCSAGTGGDKLIRTSYGSEEKRPIPLAGLIFHLHTRGMVGIVH
ncbi:hypothetical protein [Photobacterium aquae]|nr:hypothetical protein [Photobacterium aquae]